MGQLVGLTVARVRLLGPWSCRVGIGLLVWAPGGLSGRGDSEGEEWRGMRSFSTPRSLAEVLATFLGRGKSVARVVVWFDGGGCWRLVGWLCGWKLACPSGGAYGACGVHFRLFQPHP